jgi:sec-independent protein translocase protein TatA
MPAAYVSDQIGGRATGRVVEGLIMGSLSIWHWIVVIGVVLLLFGRGKISDLMGDVAQGIKAFKKGMADDDKPVTPADKPAEPVRTIDQPPAPVAARTDVGSKVV